MEKEIMSIVNSLRHFRYLIWNSKVIIRTDNKDLISRKDLSSRAQRWKHQLEEYNYEFEFIPGKNNSNADLLSRLCFINCNKLKFKIEELYKFTDTRPEKSSNGTENLYKKIVIPNDKAKSILKNIHESLIHPGISKMIKTIERYLYCKKMRQIISQIICECLVCQKSKDYERYTKPFGDPIYSNKPFEFLSTDILGPLKTKHFKFPQKNEYFYILTVTDIFSRFTMPYILFNINSSSIIEKLENWIKEFGSPKKLLSDQGRQFISLETENMMEKHNINHIVTSPYNPRGKGISERINRSILQTCRLSKGLKPNELVENIFVFKNYNANRRLRQSPFELIYKYSPFEITKQNLES
ncbi:Transposon Tf2-8 polyprotein [Dictyocoela muelleri]|nr:Transposon Tf2-8 polyprotein [Dictyocoela muelleri]